MNVRCCIHTPNLSVLFLLHVTYCSSERVDGELACSRAIKLLMERLSQCTRRLRHLCITDYHGSCQCALCEHVRISSSSTLSSPEDCAGGGCGCGCGCAGACTGAATGCTAAPTGGSVLGAAPPTVSMGGSSCDKDGDGVLVLFGCSCGVPPLLPVESAGDTATAGELRRSGLWPGL